MKLDILAFGSHPDDVELGCGGTLAKSVHQGKSVGIIDLSKGELSTKGDVDTRSHEALEASRILGVDLRQNLELPDGYITNDKESQIKVIKKLREFKPEIVIATAREDRHIKANRIRGIQEHGNPQINESQESEFKGIIN